MARGSDERLVKLREPLTPAYRDDPREVSAIKLAADDPAGLVRATREKLATVGDERSVVSILDGELEACGERGVPNFQEIQSRLDPL